MRLEASSQRRKLATLVFCDIVGSTALAERLEPEVLRSVVTRWFGEMRAALEQEGGTVEKFAGDAVMAVFGVPLAREDDALRAVRAAAGMVERQAVLSGQLRRQLGEELAIRIAVNSGEVLASETGDGLVTGDAVNVAARLEQLAGPGEVLLGDVTVQLAGRAIEAVHVGAVELRGKRTPVDAYRLVRVLEADELAAVEPAAALVGREEPLAALEGHVRGVVDAGAAAVAVVTGPAGIGKTRIAQELLARVTPAAAGLHVRCEPGEGTAALAGLARALVGASGESEEARRLAARLAQGEPAPPAEARWAVQQLLEAVARERPCVAVLDDLQRAGPVLLDLVEDAARGAVPLALICLAREDEASRLPSAGLQLALGPLASQDSDDLLDRLLAETAVDAALRRRLREAAGGNPLFAEELAAMVATSEVAGSFALPPTLSALLGARLDRLSAEDRLALDAASVEGETFAPATVAALAGAEAAERIGPLEATGVVHRVGDGRLRFHHVLLRDAAYAALSKARRAELHERLARTVDGRANALSARHLEQAATYRRELGLDPDEADALAAEASQRYGVAGLRALAGGDVPAAVELLGRAVELGGGPELRLALGDALADAGDVAGADQVLAEVEAAGGAPALLARLGRLEHGPYRELASPAAAEAVERAEAALAADDAGLARSAVVRARIARAHCRSAASAVELERALDHARAASDERLQRAARVELAGAVVAGPTPVARALIRIAELEAEVGSGRATLASLRAARGLLEAMDGELDAGRALAAAAVAVLSELGLAAAEADAVALLTRIELLAGRADEAARLVVPALGRVQSFGDRQRVGVLAALAGDALLGVGRADLAQRHARAARSAASRDDLAARIHWRSLEARLQARAGQPQEAATLAREALALARETDWLDLRGDAAMAVFEVASQADAAAEARAALAEALECYREKGNRVAAERASF